MDLEELGDMGSGCEGEHCGLASVFPEDCLNQECQWEEPMFGLIELACVTVIYIPLMLFGLLGNILTILVVWLRPHMRSSTYLYLSSMAVSDLLILLLLPLDLYKLWRPRPWPLGDLVCKLTMFLSECCTFCTILHITFLSLERYLAVCWPITAKTLVTRRRTRALIGCLWLGAAVSAAPVLIMVGVEEVGGEEQGLGGWSDDGGWSGGEGEQGGFLTGGGSGHMSSMKGGSEGREWAEKAGELKWVGDKGEIKVGMEDGDERKEDGGKMTNAKQENEGGEMEVEGERGNKMKEDEGGGEEEGTDGEMDNRECRCTDYAVSSGLLSAMMILSNLYFLVPLCILALVYSLIGRALWLRPQSSRRDQSHRHTVKMLGVIVLAFVLCWLPFHVGRTIFSLSLGTGSYSHEAHADADANLHMKPPSDVSVDRDHNAHAEPVSRAQAEGGQIFCATCATTEVNINARTDADAAARAARSRTSLNARNETLVCRISENNTPDDAPHAAHAYTVTPTGLHGGGEHNDTRLDDARTQPDAHLYFLYYLSQYFNLASSVLFYLSAAVNPLLYNLMSARYRHAVQSLVHSHAPSRRLRTLTARHSTTTL